MKLIENRSACRVFSGRSKNGSTRLSAASFVPTRRPLSWNWAKRREDVDLEIRGRSDLGEDPGECRTARLSTEDHSPQADARSFPRAAADSSTLHGQVLALPLRSTRLDILWIVYECTPEECGIGRQSASTSGATPMLKRGRTLTASDGAGSVILKV